MKTIAAGVVGVLLLLTTAPARADQAQGTYKIGPGDVLDIIVWRSKDLTMSVTVRPDGWISFPLAGDVEAAGMTPTQLQAKLEATLVKFVNAPLITIVVSKVAGFKVSILGKVRQPGRFDVESSATVLDVLALAGGPNDYADTSGIYVLRRVGPGEGLYQRISASFAATVVAGKDNANLRMQAGDIVIVP
jgi:polysaccharide export outer membrane protein